MLNPVNHVQNALKDLIDVVIGPKDGIINNLNCGFLKQYIKVAHTDLCANILPNTAKLAVLFCVLGFVAFCMSLCNLCLTIRIKPPGYKEKVHHTKKHKKNIELHKMK